MKGILRTSKTLIYLMFRYELCKRPTDFKRLYWARIKSRSEFAKEILASNNIAVDWMKSRVLLDPLWYSSVIPSFAISAAFTCALIEARILSDVW